MIERQQRSWKSDSLALLALAIFLLLVLAPLVMLFHDMLSGGAAGLDTARAMLRDQPMQQVILRTLAVALLACGLASILAIPAAFLVVRSSAPVRILVQIIGFLPLTMPPFVSAAVLQHFVGIAENASGIPWLAGLNLQGSNIALILVFALHYLPFVLFSLIAGLTDIDRAVAESARNLGAGRLFAWRRITLPLATPAYLVGAALVILRILEDVGTPLMLGIEGMLAPQIVMRFGVAGLSDPFMNISALVLLGASVTVAALAWSALVTPPGPSGLKPCTGPPPRVGLILGLPLILVLGMFALAPHVWLLLMSFGRDWSIGLLPGLYTTDGLRQTLTETLPLLTDTLSYAVGAGVLTLLIGGAFAVSTMRSGPVSRAVRFASNSLFAIPGLLLALAYVNAQGILDGPSAGWSGLAWLALMLVLAFKQLPLARHLVARRLRELHAGEMESAYNLGSSHFAARLRIALPSLVAVFSIVFLMGFAATVVELSAVLLLFRDPQAPFALHLFRALQTAPVAGTAAIQALVLLTLNATALLLAFWLLRRRCRRPIESPAHNFAVVRKAP